MLFPPFKRPFDIFHVCLKSPKNWKFFGDKFFHGFICVCYHFRNIQITIFSNALGNKFKRSVDDDDILIV